MYAAPVPVTLLKEYEAAGIEVRQLYGMTEANTGTVLDAENAFNKAGSCGRPFMHTQVRLVDLEGQDVPPGVMGEVLMKGPNMMKGYWNRPEDTPEPLWTAGSIPATWPRWTRTAFTTSRTARRI